MNIGLDCSLVLPLPIHLVVEEREDLVFSLSRVESREVE
jgi:hypothetical protein